MRLDSLKIIPERSSAGFKCTFKDQTGALCAPKKVIYTLVDQFGHVVNKIERKNFTPLSAQITIVLNGPDTQVLRFEESKNLVFRRLIVEGFYDSTWGIDLSVNAFYDFAIKNSKFLKNAIYS